MEQYNTTSIIITHDLTCARETGNRVAMLLEGKFKSLYQNRMTDELQAVLRDSLKTPFKEVSEENKMIVIADGDMATNEFGKNDQPFSLGYYKYTGDYFNNKNFLLNCIH